MLTRGQTALQLEPICQGGNTRYSRVTNGWGIELLHPQTAGNRATLQWQQMATSLQMGNPLALECSEVQRTHPTDHKGLRPTRPSNEQWRQDNAHTDTLQTQNCSSDYSASDKMRSATRARRIESALAGDNSGLSTRDSKLAMTDAIPTS